MNSPASNHTCLYGGHHKDCRQLVDGSLEHVVGEGVGGSLASTTIACSVCNPALGRAVDDGFTDFHRPILIHLGALMNRDFQKKRIIHRTSAGHQMEVTAGGVATIKGIKVIKDDAGVPIQIIGPVDRVPEMKRIAQSLGLSFKFEEVPYNVLAPEAVLEVARGFDNAMHPRGAAKALLEMIDYADQNRLLAPAKLPLRLARTQAFAAVR